MEHGPAVMYGYVLMPDHVHAFVGLDDRQIDLSGWKESYEEKWHYVRENPVRTGLVKRWQDWTFGGKIFDLEYYSE